MIPELPIPPAVEKIRERTCCPRCGARRSDGEVLVLVFNPTPRIWAIGGHCFRCQHQGFGCVVEVLGDEVDDQAGDHQAGQEVSQPRWYAALMERRP